MLHVAVITITAGNEMSTDRYKRFHQALVYNQQSRHTDVHQDD